MIHITGRVDTISRHISSGSHIVFNYLFPEQNLRQDPLIIVQHLSDSLHVVYRTKHKILYIRSCKNFVRLEHTWDTIQCHISTCITVMRTWRNNRIVSENDIKSAGATILLDIVLLLAIMGILTGYTMRWRTRSSRQEYPSKLLSTWGHLETTPEPV